MTAEPTLAQRLGRDPEARIVVVSCDDVGMLPPVTDGVLDAICEGVATTGSLMVPAPSAPAAAALVVDLDVGVHLTLNCEWDQLPWSPVTNGRSLRREDGTMFRSVEGLLDHADPDEVAAEIRAQIDLALSWGIDVTHLDSHMYAVQDHSPFHALYVQAAVDYGLPIRLSGSHRMPSTVRSHAAAAGVVTPDHLVALRQVGSRADLFAALADLPAGVSEFHAHPARDSPQLRATLPDWEGRVDDHQLYCTDVQFRQALSGVELIGYRELRDLMRSTD